VVGFGIEWVATFAASNATMALVVFKIKLGVIIAKVQTTTMFAAKRLLIATNVSQAPVNNILAIWVVAKCYNTVANITLPIRIKPS